MDSQGPVVSLKEFAARRANREDRQRLGREVSEILKVEKMDELQRRLRDVVSVKVQAALQRMQEDASLNLAVGTDFAMDAETTEHNVSPSANQTSPLKRTNQPSEANQRAVKEQQILKQKTLGMEMRQRARLAKTERAHKAAGEALLRMQEKEFAVLIKEQASEMQEFTEACTRMLAIGAKWVPDNVSNTKPWITQLKNHRYHPSKHLTDIHREITKLDELGGGESQKAAALQRKLEVESVRDLQDWRERLLVAALGDSSASILSSLAASHKLAQSKLLDRHALKARTHAKECATALRLLNRHFRSEREQLAASAKALASEAATVHSPRSARWGRSFQLVRDAGIEEAAAMVRGKPGVLPKRSDGSIWVAPKRAGLLVSYEESREQENDASKGPDSVGVLLRLLWMKPGVDVLRAVLRHPRGMSLFRDFIELRSKRELLGLTLWQQAQACFRIDDAREREREAMALYDAHCSVGTDAAMQSLSASEVIELLSQRAQRVLLKLQETWLGPFLEAHGIDLVRLMHDMNASPEAARGSDFGSLERLKGTWLEMFREATELLPHALIVADMHEPGAKLVCVNAAFEHLTGYKRESVLGTNCRFLQGDATEQDTLRRLVESLRNAQPVQVELTNYRENGSTFCNLLSIQPVHDSSGAYRFSIGMLVDMSSLSKSDREGYERIYRLLPSTFDAALQPPQYPPLDQSQVDDISHDGDSLQLRKLLLMRDSDRSLRTMLQLDAAVKAFADYLSASAPDAVSHLNLIIKVREMTMLPHEEQKKAHTLDPLVREATSPGVNAIMTPDDVPFRLREKGTASIAFLAQNHLPGFLRSSASDDTVLRVMLIKSINRAQTSARIEELLWKQYQPSPDIIGWLRSVTDAAELMPIPVSLSDMRIPGNPLVYVNQAFCRRTGYSRQEVQGRNCRFLQGPETEVAAVAALVDGLRHGRDVTVKMTNYKRSGNTFCGLVSLRPVHDSNGVYRFCVSVQADTEAQASAELEMLKAIIDLMPRNVRLSRNTAMCGPFHDRGSNHASENGIDAMVQQAVFNTPYHLDAPSDIRDSTRFDENNKLINASSLAIPDVVPLTALLWLCPATSQRLEEAFVESRVATLLESLVVQLERKVGSSGDLRMFSTRLPPEGHPTRPSALATVIVRNMTAFLEAEGPSFIQTCLLEQLGQGSLPFVAGNATWLEMFREATELLPHALIVADMHEPGAKLVCVNAAFEHLTGYKRESVLGTNCRFLQGDATEQDTLRRLVESLRNAQPVQVELTNYRENGSTFCNLLSIQPVHDSSGAYRFSIGMLVDMSSLSKSDREGYERIYRLLPSTFDAALQPLPFVVSAPTSNMKSAASLHEGLEAMRAHDCALRKIVWLKDLRLCLHKLVSHSPSAAAFRTYLAQRSHAACEQLSFLGLMQDMEDMPEEERKGALARIAAVHLGASQAGDMTGGVGGTDWDAVKAQLQTQQEDCASSLARSFLPGFLLMDSSTPAVDHLQTGLEHAFASSSHLSWDEYSIAPDAMHWFHSLIDAIENIPIAMSISDMRVAGNPLVYVNQEFCRDIGYSKNEAQGRNCRFLQGPETEVAAVAALVDGLRHGREVTVRMTNYRRSGETFGNLVSLRPVHDSNGVCRFCIGVQADAIKALEDLDLLAALLMLLPTQIATHGQPCGPVNDKSKQDGRTLTYYRAMIHDAITDPSGGTQIQRATDVRGVVRFSRCHTVANKQLGVFNPSRQFTRLLWLANPEKVFDALLSISCFRELFSEHMCDSAMGAPSGAVLLWRSLAAISGESGGATNASKSTSDPSAPLIKARNKMVGLLQSRRRSLPQIRQEFLKLKASALPQILADGCFATFLQSPRCLRLLEQMNENSTNEEIPQVTPGTWVDMFEEATAQLPYALIAADMTEPGAKIVGINPAFEHLTHYSRAETIGKNCRFLQGSTTELHAVQRITEAIRAAQPFNIELTNYTAEGSPFRNLLSLQPVHDTDGIYRYSIGLLADAASLSPAEREHYDLVRRLLPRLCEDSGLEEDPLTSYTNEPICQDVRRSVAKLIFLSDPAFALSALTRDDSLVFRFASHLGSRRAILEFWNEASEIETIFDAEQREERAREVAKKYLDSYAASNTGRSTAATVQHEAQVAFELLTECIPSFVTDPFEGSVAIDLLLRQEGRLAFTIDKAPQHTRSLLWNRYHLKADTGGWLLAFIAVVEDCGLSVSISAISQPGNPLIYVNKAFCDNSGYARFAVYGRNCRFLQGPETEISAVASMKKQLRNGCDGFCCVTNYRASSESFEHLLGLRTVHDDSGQARFCIGVSLSLTEYVQQHQLLGQMSRFFAGLPDKVGQRTDVGHSEPSSVTKQMHNIRSRLAQLASSHMEMRERRRPNKIFQHDPPVERLRWMTELTRLHWSTMPVIQVAEMLLHRDVADRFIGYVHAQSGQTAEELRTFVDQIAQQQVDDLEIKAQSANDDGMEEELDISMLDSTVWLSREQKTYLEKIRQQYIEPFMMSEERLGELVSQTSSSSFALDGTATWVGMLSQATQNLPFALVAADMLEPGALLVSVNAAFEKLTGYRRSDVLGKNCRFLQGFQTEQDAVKRIVHGLRTAKPVQVELTNYRANGSTFRNLLSIRPVYDSRGIYRYCIAMLSDAASMSGAARASFERTFAQLPQRCAALQDEQVSASSSGDQPETGTDTTGCAKIRMLSQLDVSLKAVLEDARQFERFREHIAGIAQPAASEALAFYSESVKFFQLSAAEQREKVHSTFGKFGGAFENKSGSVGDFASKHAALTAVRARREQVMDVLKAHIPSFICSPQSDTLAATARSERAATSTIQLVWEAYTIPRDSRSWLLSIVDAVDAIPVSVSIADLRIAGSPLVYVNQEFCKLSGYSKNEAQGRNCRFLQGPETEVAAVAALVDGLRHGREVTVRMTNYRRSGETFGNLVSLRPVHDSNGVCRFCIGVQFDAAAKAADIDMYISLMALMPIPEIAAMPRPAAKMSSSIAVSAETGTEASRASPTFQRPRPRALSTTPIEHRCRFVRKEVEKALTGKIPTERADDLREATRFSEHHELIVDELNRMRDHTNHNSVDREAQTQVISHAEYSSSLEAKSISRALLAFTKIMWFRYRSPEYVQYLLSIDVVRQAWLESMRNRNQSIAPLNFCCTMAHLKTLHGQEYHKMLFRTCTRFVGHEVAMDANELDAIVRETEQKVLKELLACEFAAFLASPECDVVINQLHVLKSQPIDKMKLHLVPPTDAIPHLNVEGHTSEATQMLSHAICGYSMGVMLCDRTLPGLPIVCVSEGVVQLTGYAPSDLIGINCRILQGTETEKETVEALADAIRCDEGCEVTLTNYRKDGHCFANQLMLSHTLLMGPDAELVAAILRAPPQPLSTARSDAEASQFMEVLTSCSSFTKTNNQPERVVSRPPIGFAHISSELQARSRERFDDAETTLNNILRVPNMRAIFLRSALASRCREIDTYRRGGALPPDIDMDVQLIMHSENVLGDRELYLKSACCLWVEVDALHKSGRSTAAIAAMDKKYVQPERGTRRQTKVWRALRQIVYDPLDSGQHDPEEGTVWAAASNVHLLTNSITQHDACAGGNHSLWRDLHRRSSRQGGVSIRTSRVAESNATGSQNILIESLGRHLSKIAEGAELQQHVHDEQFLESPPPQNVPDDAKVKGLTFLSELSDLGTAFDDTTEAEIEAHMERDSLRSSRRSSRGPSRSTSPTQSENGSRADASEAVSKDAESLRDLCMLQHVLLRVMIIDVLPTFLLSMDVQAEVRRELLSHASRKPLHDVLELGMNSLRTSLPSSSEEWALMFRNAVQYLPHPVLLCDMSLPGAPIICVNSAFEMLTGYEASECVGSSCRFLQGKRTDRKALLAISNAIRTQVACHVTLQNYKRDGTAFLNLLSIKPIFDANDYCRYMVGCPVEVSEHFSGTKTQIRHVDRLLKLTTSKLCVSSSREATRRMEQVKISSLRLQAHDDSLTGKDNASTRSDPSTRSHNESPEPHSIAPSGTASSSATPLNKRSPSVRAPTSASLHAIASALSAVPASVTRSEPSTSKVKPLRPTGRESLAFTDAARNKFVKDPPPAATTNRTERMRAAGVKMAGNSSRFGSRPGTAGTNRNASMVMSEQRSKSPRSPRTQTAPSTMAHVSVSVPTPPPKKSPAGSKSAATAGADADHATSFVPAGSKSSSMVLDAAVMSAEAASLSAPTTNTASLPSEPEKEVLAAGQEAHVPPNALQPIGSPSSKRDSSVPSGVGVPPELDTVKSLLPSFLFE